MGSGFCAGLSGWCRAKYRGHMHFGIGVKLFLVLYLLFLLVIGLMSGTFAERIVFEVLMTDSV